MFFSDDLNVKRESESLMPGGRLLQRSGAEQLKALDTMVIRQTGGELRGREKGRGWRCEGC